MTDSKTFTLIPNSVIDSVLTAQIAIAWAGEGGDEPRLGWWRTDLKSEFGGEDFFTRLLPHSWKWAVFQALREAARRRDTQLRQEDHDADLIVSLYSLGFEIDERTDERLVEFKRTGKSPMEALPALKDVITDEWNSDHFTEWLQGQILDIVTGDEKYPFLSQPVAALLDQERQRLRPLVEPRVGGINSDGNGNEIMWWTFAGGRINSTIRYALGALEPNWTITPDNFALRVRNEGLTETQFRLVARQLKSPEFWDNETVWQQIRLALPGYRLSKFQPLMPQWVEQEVLFNYLLDREGALAWLRKAA